MLEWDAIERTVTLTSGSGAADVARSAQSREDLFLAQARAFLAAAAGGSDGERPAPGEDGVRALAVCDAAREASRARRELSVNYP
jgi:predicted dehydrogenase